MWITLLLTFYVTTASMANEGILREINCFARNHRPDYALVYSHCTDVVETELTGA